MNSLSPHIPHLTLSVHSNLVLADFSEQLYKNTSPSLFIFSMPLSTVLFKIFSQHKLGIM